MPAVRSASEGVLDGRYRLGPLLGRGGMADVRRATDLVTGSEVAVKLFRNEVAIGMDPDRAARETEVTRELRHPAIVQVLATSRPDTEQTYLVLELVEGGDLGALLDDGPLPAETVREITADVADALAILHARRLVHRDVKPGNILVLEHPGPVAAKLADFGIVAALDGTRLTATDAILGTAAYLSPEQVGGEDVGTASDVYSLGLVMLEALTGERAFPGGLAESAVARLNRPPRLPADASPRLASLLSAMTALDPAHRPHATEVAASLRALEGRMTGGIDATARLPRIVSAPRARPPAPARLAAAAAAVVLVLGTGVALLADGGSPVAVPAADGTAAVAPEATSAGSRTPQPAPSAASVHAVARTTAVSTARPAPKTAAHHAVSAPAAPAAPSTHATKAKPKHHDSKPAHPKGARPKPHHHGAARPKPAPPKAGHPKPGKKGARGGH